MKTFADRAAMSCAAAFAGGPTRCHMVAGHYTSYDDLRILHVRACSSDMRGLGWFIHMFVRAYFEENTARGVHKLARTILLQHNSC